MATTSQKDREDERRRRVAAATAASAPALVPPPLPVVVQPAPPVEVVSAAARATAAATILGSLVTFLTVKRQNDAEKLRELLSSRARPDAIQRVIADETKFEVLFAESSAKRFSHNLATVLGIPETDARERAVRGLLKREAQYARQRSQAMFARAIAAADRSVVRELSPDGGFWKLDPDVQEHTAGCLIMGGKFWPWAVLDRVHPPRHHGCPCRIISYGEALRQGLLRPADVMSVRDAIGAASGVVMEAVDADGLLAELDAREQLVESGLVTQEALDRVPFVGIQG